MPERRTPGSADGGSPGLRLCGAGQGANRAASGMPAEGSGCSESTAPRRARPGGSCTSAWTATAARSSQPRLQKEVNDGAELDSLLDQLAASVIADVVAAGAYDGESASQAANAHAPVARRSSSSMQGRSIPTCPSMSFPIALISSGWRT